MESVEPLQDIPNLSGQIELVSRKPYFNGQYSTVYHGKLGDELVGVKVLKEIYGADTHTMLRKLKRERTVWWGSRHPNILPLYGFAEDHELFEPFGALISPWRAKGNAFVFLQDRGEDLSVDERLSLWEGVVAGVEYLHSHTPVLIHGDLKTVNILIDECGTPQICDFGLVSIYLDEGHSGMTTTTPHSGTDRYLAYELLDAEAAAPTKASDIHALGCIGLEFYFLQLPYAHRKNNMRGHIFADIKAKQPPAVRPPLCHPHDGAMWDLLSRCWLVDPSARPTVQQLCTDLKSLSQDRLTRDSTNDFNKVLMHDNIPQVAVIDPESSGKSNLSEGVSGQELVAKLLTTDLSVQQAGSISSAPSQPQDGKPHLSHPPGLPTMNPPNPRQQHLLYESASAVNSYTSIDPGIDSNPRSNLTNYSSLLDIDMIQSQSSSNSGVDDPGSQSTFSHSIGHSATPSDSMTILVPECRSRDPVLQELAHAITNRRLPDLYIAQFFSIESVPSSTQPSRNKSKRSQKPQPKSILRYKCLWCGGDWVGYTREKARQHFLSDLGMKGIACKELGCTWKTVRPSDLARHMKLVHKKEQQAKRPGSAVQAGRSFKELQCAYRNGERAFLVDAGQDSLPVGRKL